jgi:hypothetical protein
MGHYASEMHLDVKGRPTTALSERRHRERASLIFNEFSPRHIERKMHDQLLELFVDSLLEEGANT